MKIFNYRKNFDNQKVHPQSQEEKADFVESYGWIEKCKRLIGYGSTIFFRISLVIFLLIVVGGTCYAEGYTEWKKKWAQRRSTEIETDIQEHERGETFLFEGRELLVTDVKILNSEAAGFPLQPLGKRLIAVKVSGKSDGQLVNNYWLPPAYIYYEGYCYWQISKITGPGYENRYRISLFDLSNMQLVSESEGWLLFWVDKDRQEFTLCLEERVEGYTFIQTIHSIDICLSGEAE